MLSTSSFNALLEMMKFTKANDVFFNISIQKKVDDLRIIQNILINTFLIVEHDSYYEIRGTNLTEYEKLRELTYNEGFTYSHIKELKTISRHDFLKLIMSADKPFIDLNFYHYDSVGVFRNTKEYLKPMLYITSPDEWSFTINCKPKEHLLSLNELSQGAHIPSTDKDIEFEVVAK